MLVYDEFRVPEQFARELSTVNEAKAHFGWFCQQIPSRLAQFEFLTAETGGSADCTSFLPSSLAHLGQWFDSQVESRQLAPGELLARQRELPPWIWGTLDDWALSDRSVSVSIDLGIYLGEFMIRNHGELMWDFVRKPKRDADLYLPVVLPFSNGMHLNPLRIAMNIAIGVVKGTSASERLPQVYEFWASYAPKI